ncbi:MAG: RNA polymerase sigma factor [Phycisphaerales bacterium]
MSDAPPHTLSDLARVASTGDRPSFDAIHARLAGAVRRLLLTRLGNRADLVDDLSQRTWMGVWNALSRRQYDPERSAITTFVYAVATKVWLQHARTTMRARVAIPGHSPDDFDAAEAEEPVDSPGLAERVHAVRECLQPHPEGLTSDESWLLRAAADGATDRDLAKRLGVAPSTAHARRKAALDKLRRLLARRGIRGESTERDAINAQEQGDQGGSHE